MTQSTLAAKLSQSDQEAIKEALSTRVAQMSDLLYGNVWLTKVGDEWCVLDPVGVEAKEGQGEQG